MSSLLLDNVHPPRILSLHVLRAILGPGRLRLRLLCALMALCLLLPGNALAQWAVKEETNVMTGSKRKVAQVENDEEQTFSLYTNSQTNEVWANFSLPESVLEYISPKTLPTYKVDDHEAVRPTREWYPKWMNLLIWDGQRVDGKIGPQLLEIMNGQKLTIKYRLATGEKRTAEFSLQGAAPAITEALHLQP